MKNIVIVLSPVEFASLLKSDDMVFANIVAQQVERGELLVSSTRQPDLLEEIKALVKYDPAYKNKIQSIKNLREGLKDNFRLLAFFPAKDVVACETGSTLGLAECKNFVEKHFPDKPEGGTKLCWR